MARAEGEPPRRGCTVPRRARRIRDPEPRRAARRRAGSRHLSPLLRAVRRFEPAAADGDALPHARCPVRRRRPARPRRCCARTGVARAALRRVDRRLERDRGRVRREIGAAHGGAPARLPRLRHPLPCARERRGFCSRLRGLGARRLPCDYATVGAAVRRRRPVRRCARAHAPREPGAAAVCALSARAPRVVALAAVGGRRLPRRGRLRARALGRAQRRPWRS